MSHSYGMAPSAAILSISFHLSFLSFRFPSKKKKENETKKFLKKIVSQVMAILRWLNSRQRKINPFSFRIFLNESYVQNSVTSHRVLACLRSSNKSNRTGDRLNEQSAASAIIVCWTSYIWLCPEWQMAANIAQLLYYIYKDVVSGKTWLSETNRLPIIMTI